MNKVKICILDTETNGLPQGNDFSKIDMLELAYIIVDTDLNFIKKQNFLVKNNTHVPKVITELTGITEELLNNEGIAPTEIFKQFNEDLKECEFIIAHNLRFDYNILKNEIKKLKNKTYMENLSNKIQLCSLGIFKNELEKPFIQNYKLQTIYNYLHTKPFTQTHRALDDVNMIRDSFLKINDFKIKTHYWNKKVIFGKYKQKNYNYLNMYHNHYRYYNFMLNKVHKINPSKLRYFLKR